MFELKSLKPSGGEGCQCVVHTSAPVLKKAYDQLPRSAVQVCQRCKLSNLRRHTRQEVVTHVPTGRGRCHDRVSEGMIDIDRPTGDHTIHLTNRSERSAARYPQAHAPNWWHASACGSGVSTSVCVADSTCTSPPRPVSYKRVRAVSCPISAGTLVRALEPKSLTGRVDQYVIQQGESNVRSHTIPYK